VIIILPWHLLVALMKLIANAAVLHGLANELLKSVVMTLNFERICNNMLDPVVMTYNLNFINHSKLRLAIVALYSLGENFVIMTSNE